MKHFALNSSMLSSIFKAGNAVCIKYKDTLDSRVAINSLLSTVLREYSTSCPLRRYNLSLPFLSLCEPHECITTTDIWLKYNLFLYMQLNMTLLVALTHGTWLNKVYASLKHNVTQTDTQPHSLTFINFTVKGLFEYILPNSHQFPHYKQTKLMAYRIVSYTTSHFSVNYVQVKDISATLRCLIMFKNSACVEVAPGKSRGKQPRIWEGCSPPGEISQFRWGAIVGMRRCIIPDGDQSPRPFSCFGVKEGRFFNGKHQNF